MLMDIPSLQIRPHPLMTAAIYSIFFSLRGGDVSRPQWGSSKRKQRKSMAVYFRMGPRPCLNAQTWIRDTYGY